MIQTLIQYGLFLVETVTIVVALLFLIGGVLNMLQRDKSASKNSILITSINDKYKDFARSLNRSILPKKMFQKLMKEEKAKQKRENNKVISKSNRIFIINFYGDIRASAIETLREEVTAILTTAKEDDEVLLRLESGGGMVHSYGLAASQLIRLKKRGIKLTIAVDKIAASGGYMMACIADHLIAAQFAVIGSVGVIAQIPNFSRLLKEKSIDFEQITAGKHKRTLTMFGENSEEDRDKLREELEDTHLQFKDFVVQYRKEIEIEKIATGEHWFGQRALDLNLVDEISTSDDFLLEKSENFDLYEIKYEIKKSISEKIPFLAQNLLNRIAGWMQSTDLQS
ncbi:MAG: protease SohB [Proteobacteria bacterium]|nr:protease SohB [Pseudomonadota bacterium]